MPFFTYTQNNSGGWFTTDERIACYVIIEADDYKEANSRAEDIGLYFDGFGDCECCGSRWCAKYSDDKGDDEPRVYGKTMNEFNDRDSVRIHYKDKSKITEDEPSRRFKTE